jgi:prepilin-type N-terminal cleavage/methylation domain-containing protein/prepilin-type processing-associated H-X9-DG protein
LAEYSRRLCHKKRPATGFSLVELLIVIAIIALLMAILTPVLVTVRKAARGTVCLANLQQWGHSYQMYVSNNAGRSFVDRQEITGPAWYEVLAPYNGNLERTLLCPEATEPGNAIGSASWAWGPTRTYDTAAPSWIARGVFVGSYGFNGWLWAIRNDLRAGLPTGWQRSVIDLPARRPALVPVFADCIMEWGMPQDTDDVPRNLDHPLPFYNGIGPKPWGPKGQLSWFCIDRHRMAINVVFLDGHAERVGLADLWKLRWNNDFTPGEVQVPAK